MPNDKKVHNFTEKLSSEQKAKLKGLAHHLKPVVQVGSQGFSENVLKEINLALEKHELIKVQLPSNTDASTKKNEQIELENVLQNFSHVIGRIGRSVILYKEKDPKDAKIVLKKL
ncbi:YhbY family RNA-binding protein [Pigmentibacter ruber]|uniref:YhbY family RNA-binding protein n=1 Tax=Pigmentibacter ruber TaxID=2683196 RepID=UPI00131BB331|nr:YhbY family RNA-binding protein [Pigmentibacter ruber]BFD32006.1 ribosome assembly RNA-binding protein YhbY [Pigmentibacter ruber]